jgi:hypothetical protein
MEDALDIQRRGSPRKPPSRGRRNLWARIRCGTVPERVEVRLAGGYPLRQLERLIRDLDPLLHLDEQAQIVVDLGGLVHISPAGLALLAAALRRLSHDWLVAPGSEVVPPRSRLTHDYLLRMDVIQLGLATCGSKRGSSVTIRLVFGLATIS